MSAPIKLLFIIDRYKNPYAGTEGQLLKLLRGLDSDRFQPVLAVFRGSDYLEQHGFPVPVDVLDISRMILPVSWIRLYRYFRRRKQEGYRLAHIFFNDASIICPPILKLLGYRVLISRRDMGYWQTPFNLLPLRINARYVDGVIVNSMAVKRVTVENEGYRPERVSVIYNGYPVAEDTAPEGAGVHAGNDALRMVLVANIRPIKRIQDAIHAVHEMKMAGTECALTVIGDGNSADLRHLCSELGVSGNVSFPGPCADVPSLLPSFDVGLLCSESEGFSNTLIEYLQSGLAVVCTNVGGNPEIIVHGMNGLLYEAGDVEKLSRHLLDLAANRELGHAMGRAGKERVKLHFSLSTLVSAHQEIYESLLNEK